MLNRCPVSSIRYRVAFAALASLFAALPAVADIHILPQGAGTKDGSSWQNARDANAGAAALQAAWDALPPGETLWLGSGTYANARLTISKGGEAGKLKTLAGKDTGGGAPVFTGTFNKDNPAKSGATFITAADGADYWAVQDIHIRDYNLGIASKAGGHQGVRIRNFDVTGAREGISLNGGAVADKPETGSHDIEIADCDFVNFTKRGIRLKGGNYDIRISNCVADAGGKEWATEPFHMGFSVEGPGDHDITYTNCVALNSYHDAGEGYWNADGFCAERVDKLRYVNCMAFDNTDGGWDLKAENVTLEGCIALGNKRNFRFWGATTKLIRCLSAESVYPGGTGGDLGLWTKGTVAVENSTFYNAALSADDDGKITVTNSIIARSKAKPGRVPLGEKEGLKLTNTVLWDEAAAPGENPQFVNPSPQWNGAGDAFDSRKFNPAQGFFNTIKTAPRFQRTHPLTPANRSKAADAGTDENDPPKTPEQLALEAAKQPVLANSGFENGLTGWNKMAPPAFIIKSEGASEGQGFVTVTAGANRVEAEAKITSLVEGETYTLTFKSRGNTSNDARIIIRKNAGGSYLGVVAPAKAPAWTATSLKFTAPGREVLLQISVRAAGTFDLDDFVLKRGK